MRKFARWIMTCNPTRIEAIENLGLSIMICGLLVGSFAQYLEPLAPFAVCIISIAIGLSIWCAGIGMKWLREEIESETT